jgi:hypothetical protein
MLYTVHHSSKQSWKGLVAYPCMHLTTGMCDCRCAHLNRTSQSQSQRHHHQHVVQYTTYMYRSSPRKVGSRAQACAVHRTTGKNNSRCTHLDHNRHLTFNRTSQSRPPPQSPPQSQSRPQSQPQSQPHSQSHISIPLAIITTNQHVVQYTTYIYRTSAGKVTSRTQACTVPRTTGKHAVAVRW